MKNFKLVLVSALLFSAFAVVSSCKKKKDTIVKVYVKDSDGNAVSSCTVIVYAKPSTNAAGKDTISQNSGVTNSAGEAIFNYNDLYQLGQAGVAVLDIKAYRDTLYGEGVIQVEEETTSESTVIVK